MMLLYNILIFLFILGNTFPPVQFLVNGFSEPYRLEINTKGGGVMIYILEDIPSKLLDKDAFPYNIEVYLLNSFLGNVNGYFLEHSIY